jgi:molecular chaperone GrpE
VTKRKTGPLKDNTAPDTPTEDTEGTPPFPEPESGAPPEGPREQPAPAAGQALETAKALIEAGDVEGLRSILMQQEAQAAEYLDGWQRSRAEFANYRKRTDREAEDSRARITAEILTGYLGILDDFERALKDRPTEGEVGNWADGIELILRKMKAVLDSAGIEVIPAIGERFDPTIHEALTLEDSEDHDEGMVIDVLQQGYRLGDRVLRPALVRVAK